MMQYYIRDITVTSPRNRALSQNLKSGQKFTKVITWKIMDRFQQNKDYWKVHKKYLHIISICLPLGLIGSGMLVGFETTIKKV